VRGEDWDPRYYVLQRSLAEAEEITIPTLMIQGAADYCDPPSESEGLCRFFTGGYRRVVLENIGDFPQREAPDLVADLVLEHLRGDAEANS
jgi:pimeloyl-ACP methyl ester carboxylesterase